MPSAILYLARLYVSFIKAALAHRPPRSNYLTQPGRHRYGEEENGQTNADCWHMCVVGIVQPGEYVHGYVHELWFVGTIHLGKYTYSYIHIDGLVQERYNSSALAMELCLSCDNPLIYPKNYAHSLCFVVFCCGWKLNDFTHIIHHSHFHYKDVIMVAMVSQITSLAIVYSAV